METHNSSRMDIDDVRQFWKWFSDKYKDFGDHFENENLLNELDQQISQLGDFSWEIGPGKKVSNAFVISPNGDEELLKMTKKIVSLAPACKGWEFYYAKPPKDWDFKFSVKEGNGDSYEINANDWEYVLLKYSDNKFDVIFKAPQLNDLDSETRISAAEIVLDSVLGEEKRMNSIREVDVVNEFDDKARSKSTSIVHLNNHLRRVSSTS